MLVLTRKLQEQIRIGDDITITILKVKGNAVRVGIDAPRSTRVLRGELTVKLPVSAAAEADGDDDDHGGHADFDEGPDSEFAEIELFANDDFASLDFSDAGLPPRCMSHLSEVGGIAISAV